MSPVVLWIAVVLVVVPVVALSLYSVVDLVQRDDLAGGSKAMWIAFVAFVPLIGGGLYLIFRPLRQEDIRGFGRVRRQQQRVDELLNDTDQTG